MAKIYVVQLEWNNGGYEDQTDLVAAFHDEEHAKAHARECHEAARAFADKVRAAASEAAQITRGSTEPHAYYRARNERLRGVEYPQLFCALSPEDYASATFEVISVELKVPT